ncbi:DUF2345 domain-containing protein, partial [Chitinolyticbacter albus]|uniref:DUF2345 domain-containing protein n=1 Tax=Chitinolyticbacter albus TaxID=2961951 RepID=UPI002109D46B
SSEGHLDHLNEALKAWEAGSNTDEQGKTAKEQPGQQPILIATAPAGIALTTPNELVLNAGHNLDLVSQRDTQQTTARRWVHNVGSKLSLFVQGVADKVNLKLIAAKGHVNLQAQSGDVEVVGDKNVRLYANKQKLTLVAGQELLATCGGAYIRLKGGDIEIHAPGSVSFKGTNFDFSGPASLNVPLPSFGGKDGLGQVQLHHWYADRDGVAGGRYVLTDLLGKKHEGVLDKDGKATVTGVPIGAVRTQFMEDPRDLKTKAGQFAPKVWPEQAPPANPQQTAHTALSQLASLVPGLATQSLTGGKPALPDAGSAASLLGQLDSSGTISKLSSVVQQGQAAYSAAQSLKAGNPVAAMSSAAGLAGVQLPSTASLPDGAKSLLPAQQAAAQGADSLLKNARSSAPGTPPLAKSFS